MKKMFFALVAMVMMTMSANAQSINNSKITFDQLSNYLELTSNQIEPTKTAMAQLENSLDAKIDSLVSSYLTRNGIWNGAKQTMNSSWTSIRYGFRAGATYVANYTLFYESSGWTLRKSAAGSTEAMMQCHFFPSE